MAATTIGVGIAAYGAYSANKNQKAALKQSQSQSGPAYLDDASKGLINRATQLSQRNYTPFQGERVAGLSGNEQRAQRMATAFGDRTRMQMQPGFRPDISAFENPYISQVLNNQRRVIGEEYGRQAAGLAARQSATDAFRTGRSDLARSRLEENRMRALGDAEAAGRASAFDSAMGNYFRNEDNLRSAFGSAQQGLNQTGAAERSIRQAQNDFDYGQFLESRDWDVNNLQPLLAAIQGARGGTITTTSSSKSPGKDYWGAAAGLLGTAIQQYAGSSGSSGPRAAAPAAVGTEDYAAAQRISGNPFYGME